MSGVRTMLIACGLALAAVPRAWAQDAGQPTGTPGRLPSLDELLGIAKPGESGEEARAELPPDPSRQALDQQLTQEQAAEAFEQAVRLMGQTAERLDGAGDVGIVTQRLQEDAVRRLDAVIAAAMQNQQSNSSSSSSSSEQERQNQPSQSQRQQQQQQNANQDQPSEPQDGQPPQRQNGAGNDVQLNAAAWGALPQRLREALMQGSSDRFSSMYQSMTEQYYRRLAEEKRP